MSEKKIDKGYLKLLSVLEGAKKNGSITKFGYRTIVRPQGGLKKEDMIDVIFYKKIEKTPFGKSKALKDIPQPEVGKIYDCGKGRVFCQHPDLGLIKLMRYKRDGDDLIIKDYENVFKDKHLIQYMDEFAIKKKMAQVKKDLGIGESGDEDDR